MSRIFLDTSSLIKLYHAEPDSAQLRQQVQPTDEVIVSGLTRVEMYSAFGRKLRRGDLPTGLAQTGLRLFEQDWLNFHVVALDAKCLEEAGYLLQRYTPLALRSLDAIQLASALAAGKLDTFFTHDQRLHDAALAEGLPVR